MTDKKKQEVTTVEQAQLVAQKLAAQYGVTGTEHVDASDLQLPFLRISQGLSPEINPKDDRYIETLKLGQLFSPTTQEVFGDSIQAILCNTIKNYVEWNEDREFQGVHPINSTITDTARRDGHKLFLQNGNELALTNNLFLLLNVNGNWKPYVLPAASTFLTPARKLVSTLMGLGGGILFTRSFQLRTVERSNKFGTFYVFGYQVDEEVLEPGVMEAAAKVAKMAFDAHANNSLNLNQDTYKSSDVDNSGLVDDNTLEIIAGVDEAHVEAVAESLNK